MTWFWGITQGELGAAAELGPGPTIMVANSETCHRLGSEAKAESFLGTNTREEEGHGRPGQRESGPASPEKAHPSRGALSACPGSRKMVGPSYLPAAQPLSAGCPAGGAGHGLGRRAPRRS